jgi:hypothetical protein
VVVLAPGGMAFMNPGPGLSGPSSEFLGVVSEATSL